MLSGQTAEQVPHWMQSSNCSQPGTLMTSRPKPFTWSASYLIVRSIFIISASAATAGFDPALQRKPTMLHSSQGHSKPFGKKNLNMAWRILNLFCARR
jgi:hypothetical protein